MISHLPHIKYKRKLMRNHFDEKNVRTYVVQIVDIYRKRISQASKNLAGSDLLNQHLPDGASKPQENMVRYKIRRGL